MGQDAQRFSGRHSRRQNDDSALRQSLSGGDIAGIFEPDPVGCNEIRQALCVVLGVARNAGKLGKFRPFGIRNARARRRMGPSSSRAARLADLFFITC
jgi:hypothetical protein